MESLSQSPHRLYVLSQNPLPASFISILKMKKENLEKLGWEFGGLGILTLLYLVFGRFWFFYPLEFDRLKKLHSSLFSFWSRQKIKTQLCFTIIFTIPIFCRVFWYWIHKKNWNGSNIENPTIFLYSHLPRLLSTQPPSRQRNLNILIFLILSKP